MAHPSKVKLFIPWAKAMVAGATVDKPAYPGSKKNGKGSSMRKMRKKRKRRRKRKKGLKNA